jgi:hypothetical protein
MKPERWSPDPVQLVSLIKIRNLSSETEMHRGKKISDNQERCLDKTVPSEPSEEIILPAT